MGNLIQTTFAAVGAAGLAAGVIFIAAGGRAGAQQPAPLPVSQRAEQAAEAFYYQEPVTPARVRGEARQWLERAQHADARQLAARAEEGDEEAIATVVRDLESVSGPLRARRAVYVLIASGLQNAEVRNALADRVAQEAITVSQAASVAISWGSGAAAVLEVFEEALDRDLATNSLGFHDVYWALRVLTTAREASAPYQQRVLELAEHKIPSIRINALYCLGALGDSAPAPAKARILEATRDGTFAVRQAALIAAINLADQWTEAERKKLLGLGPWPVPDREAAASLGFGERPYDHLVELAVARAVFADDPTALAKVLQRVPEQVARSTALELLARYIAWLGPRAEGLKVPLSKLAESTDPEIRDVAIYLQDQLVP